MRFIEHGPTGRARPALTLEGQLLTLLPMWLFLAAAVAWFGIPAWLAVTAAVVLGLLQVFAATMARLAEQRYLRRVAATRPLVRPAAARPAAGSGKRRKRRR